MKFLSTIFFTFILCVGWSQTSDEQMIKDVIDNEGKYFGEGNFEKWASYWVHSPETLFIYSDSKSYGKWEGWDSISQVMKGIMETTIVENKADSILLERDNFNFVIEGNLAFVSYIQRDNFNGLQEKIETRVMRKINGEWKILFINLIKTSTYDKE